MSGITKACLALVASAVLVITMATPVAAAERDPGPPQIVGVPESTPAEPEAPTIPSGDFTVDAPAPVAPRQLTARVHPLDLEHLDFDTLEVVERDQFSTVYRLPTGGRIAVLGDAPVNVERDGEWVEATTQLERTADGWGVDDHPLAPEFPTRSDDAVTVSNGDDQLSWRLLGADDVPGSVPMRRDGTTGALRYRDAVGGSDLLYDVNSSAVKETVVLDRAPATAQTYRWMLSAPGLTVRPDGTGGFVVVDADDEVRFTIPAPVMWDSSGVTGESEDAAVPLTADVVQQGSDWLLTVRPDQQWLTAPERVYPVMVDPSVWLGPTYAWSYKSDGTFQNGTTYMGNPWQSNHSLFWRAYSRYPFQNIAGYYAVDTAMEFTYQTGTASCQWEVVGNSGTTNPTSVSSYGSDITSWTHCTGVAYASNSSIDGLDSTVVNMVKTGAYYNFLSFRNYTEPAGGYNFKGVTSRILVVYNSYPVVTGVTAATPKNGQIAPRAPKMEATATAEGGGAMLRYEFEKTGGTNTGLGAFTNIAYDTGWVSPGQFPVPSNVLESNTQYRYRVTVKDGYDTWLGNNTQRPFTNAAWYFTTNNTPVIAQSTVSPADEEVVTTTTPTFTVPYAADPDDSVPVRYKFVVTTGSDGRTGAVVTSGWLDAPDPTPGEPVEWTPVEGALQDGGSYTWRVWADDGTDEAEQAWIGHVKVDRRLGTSGPSPFDQAGPATVNLASGNVALSFASPTVATLGGPMGMSFSYNSHADPNGNKGLAATYYNALNQGQTSTTTFSFTGRESVLAQTEPAINFTQPSSVAPAVPADYFLAKWTGFITVPSAGAYTFGVIRNDGAKVTIANAATPQIDQWTTTGSTYTTNWSGTVAMPGTPTPITVDYYNATGTARLELWVKGPGIDPAGIPVPASWFTRSVRYLPGGWASSTPINGVGGFYTLATKTSSAVTLTDVTGSVHTYVKKSDGGYTAPAGEYGILTLDAAGQVSLNDGGTFYTFNAAGKVSSVASTSDAKKPATPQVTFRTPSGVPDLISDPVADGTTRKVQFVYGGDLVSTAALGLGAADGDMSGSACPVPAGSGYSTVPNGFLCRIVYPGHVAGGVGGVDDTTRLFYDASGQLVSIVDPGGEQVSFGYTDGVLTRVWDPLVNDWIAADAANRSATDTVATVFAYTGGKLTSVTSPAPDGEPGTPRPQKTYDYGAGTTTVDVTGLDLSDAPPGAHATRVTYDTGWRATSTTSALGVTSSTTWSAKDQKLSSTDALGLVSTVIYDPFTDLPTDAYGPAPASCFGSDRRPLPSCPIVPAHSSTVYDGGMQGLQVAYYATNNLSGAPKDFSLGLTGGTGTLGSRNWAAGAPTSAVGVDNFSARMNGTLTFATAGNYQFRTILDDGGRLYLNDELLINDMVADGVVSTLNSPIITGIAAGERRHIRLDMYETIGNAAITLQWSINGGAFTNIPDTALTPDYGLATSARTDDSSTAGTVTPLNTATGYGTAPWLGQVNSSTIDPGGLNLTTAIGYEAATTAANSWLRRTTRTMPTAGAAVTQSSYYTDAETLAEATCGVPAGTRQNGFLKSTVTADPDGAGSAVGVTTEYVYDLFGRVAGTRRSGDASWSCVSYDARGRVWQSVTSAFGSSPAKTTTTLFAVGGDPRVSSVSDPTGTVTATIDLLGRTVVSTDVWGTTTTPAYDLQTGRVLSVVVDPAADVPHTQEFTYDPDGKVLTVDYDGVRVATPVYDNPGSQLLLSVSYSNGSSLSSVARDANTGAGLGMTWSFPSADVNHAATPVSTSSFDTGADSWVAGTDTDLAPVTDHLETSNTAAAAGTVLASRTVTGLTVGHTYTVRAKVGNPDGNAVTDARVGVAGAGTSTPLASIGTDYETLSYGFTATATTHDLTVAYEAPAGTAESTLSWDEVILTKDAWVEDPAASTVSDAVVRSQSGRIVQNTLTDDGVAETSTYSFDTAGRLVSAVIPRHTLTYGYGTAGCGVTAAGKNGNRTSSTDAFDGGTPTVSSYCYDLADRLTLSGSLTTTGPVPTLGYDVHGNTTRLGDQTLTYDSADRHLSTVVDGGPTVTYVWGPTGEIISRTSGTEVTRFSSGLILDGAGGFVQASVSLPGGATMIVGTSGVSGAGWSYPNLHGDVILTADEDGHRTGRYAYDPFGQPIDLTTGVIGAASADLVPDTVAGSGADHAWVGANSKLYEHAGTIATIEMGARQYVPGLGRFLEVDPVEGGVTNAYDYPADPASGYDLDGQRQCVGSECRGMKIGPAGSVSGARTHTYKRTTPSASKPTGACGSWNAWCAPPPSPAAQRVMDQNAKSLSFEVGLDFCDVVCFQGGVLFSQTGVHPFAGVGVGPQFEASVHLGVATRKTPGMAWGGSCALAAGLGLYGEGGVGIGNPLGGYMGTGATVGGGIGCNVNASWMF